MNETLSAAADRVRRALTEKGFDFAVRELPTSTRTAKEAADAVGCGVAEIAKSLIFRGVISGDALLVIAGGNNRVSETRLEELAGEPIGKADAAFVREKTGFAIGGVPPTGHLQPLRTWIDADLLNHARIWAAAGTPNALFELDPRKLSDMTGGTVTRIH